MNRSFGNGFTGPETFTGLSTRNWPQDPTAAEGLMVGAIPWSRDGVGLALPGIASHCNNFEARVFAKRKSAFLAGGYPLTDSRDHLSA